MIASASKRASHHNTMYNITTRNSRITCLYKTVLDGQNHGAGFLTRLLPCLYFGLIIYIYILSAIALVSSFLGS